MPPHEVPMKGMRWFAGVRKVMTRELHELRGEVRRLREIERLAKKFKEQALPLENRNYHPRWYVAAEPLFAALDKETTPNG